MPEDDHLCRNPNCAYCNERSLLLAKDFLEAMLVPAIDAFAERANLVPTAMPRVLFEEAICQVLCEEQLPPDEIAARAKVVAREFYEEIRSAEREALTT